MSRKNIQKNRPKNGPKILVLMGWSLFQSGKGATLSAPKLDHVLKELAATCNLSFRLHVESWSPWVSSYGKYYLRFANRILELLAAVPSAFIGHSYLFVHKDETLIQSTRRLWSSIREEYWRRQLETLKPDLIIGSNLTTEEVSAAKNLDIKTIEIQHGIFEKESIDLCWPQAKPDFMALWDFVDPQILSGSGITPVRIPHPFAVTNFEFHSQSSLQPSLLVILSWGMSESIDGLGAIPKEFLGPIRKLENEFQLVFRPHPVFPKRHLKKLNEFLRSRFPHAHVQNTRSKSLADALATSTACLIDSSSVWADAVLAGTNLLVTDFSTYASATKLAELTKKSKVYFSAEQLPLEYSRQTKSKAITEIGEAWIEFRTLVLECTQIQVDSEVKKRLKHVDIAPDSTQKD